MTKWTGAALVCGTMLILVGCDKKDATPEAGEKDEAAQAIGQAEKAVEDAAEKAGATFVKDIAKKSCEILTPALIAQAFDVPEAELKQMKIMGCIYSWKEKKDGETVTTLEANLTMMRVHKTLDAAKTLFKNSTANKTGDEMKAEMKQVTGKAKEHETIDTETKKKTVDTMGSMMAEAMKEGSSYVPISGIGDEAKVAERDGAIWVRQGNLTFTANAYKGPPQPKPKLDMADMRDIKKMTAKSMTAQREWLQKPHDERKKASTKLAKVVLEALP
jgi:hypothetical protein